MTVKVIAKKKDHSYEPNKSITDLRQKDRRLPQDEEEVGNQTP